MDTVKKVLEVSGFKELNPPQKLSLKAGLLEGKNIVLTAPTASGKTLVAEFAALNTISKGKKVVYIVPLKALANEKYSDFREKYEPLKIKVAISTGDLDSSDHWLGSYDIIILTSEKMDSLMRHGIPWISSVGLVVVDEIHLLNDPGRGPTLEITITKLKQLANPQFLGLSATISNYKELAKWLDAKPVWSDYRPVKLEKGIYHKEEVHFENAENIKLGNDDPIKLLVEHSFSKGKQSLIFVSTRRSAEAQAEQLGKFFSQKLKQSEKEKLADISRKILSSIGHPTTQCTKLSLCVKKGVAFHHAGATAKQKKLIEDAFRDGFIKAITATPTLCLDKNTEIWTGVSYKNPHKITNDTVFALSGNHLKELDIQAVNFFPSPKHMIKITTETGKQIIVTENHKMLLKVKGKKQIVNACDCKRGERIATVGNLETEKYRVNRWSDFVIDNKLPFADNKLETDIYYLIGAFLGDGYSGAEMVDGKIKYKGSPSIGGNDSKIFDKIKYICKKYDIHYKEGTNKYRVPQLVLTKSNWFREFLLRCGIDVGVRKHIEKLIMMADKNSLQHLLMGLFDTNGYVESGRIVFSSISARLIWDIQRILLMYGIVSRVRKRKPDKINTFGKDYKTKRHFEISIYYAYSIINFFNKIGFSLPRKMDALKKIVKSLKMHSSQSKKMLRRGWKSPDIEGDIFWDIIKSVETVKSNSRMVYDIVLPYDRNDHMFVANGFIVHNSMGVNLPSYQVIIRDLKRFYNFKGIDYLPILEIEQMSGRAGRPKYDKEGLAIFIAKSEQDARFAWDNYIKGKPENITSKLGVEPILRMHVLALIASGIVSTRKQLFDFFSKTFYAHQYRDISGIERILDKVIEQLKSFRFIISNLDKNNNFFKRASVTTSNEELKPTKIGKRVSELYIDPLTASHMLRCLEYVERNKTNMFGYLHIISDTVEMRPLLNLRKGEQEELNKIILENESFLAKKSPNEWDWEYEDYMKSIKTALLFQRWADEVGEDRIFEDMGVTPGELRARLSNADWLLYALQELALLMGYMDMLKDIRKTRLRVKHGIKEELLPLVRMKGVGRVRARRLFNSGIKGLADIKNTSIQNLEKIVGKKVAAKLKNQVE